MTFPDPDSRSAELYARARRVLPDGGSRSTIKTSPYTLFVDHAQGAEVVDVDGNRLVDFNNNYTSLIHGHAYAPICEAVSEQIRRGSAYAFANVSELNLAELLCERVPSFQQIRFMNSGSEAVMNAIKAARAFTGRPKIAKCEGFYHGSYDFAEVSLGNGPAEWQAEDPPSTAYCAGTPPSVLDEVVVIPFNEPQHAQRILDKHAGSIACVMIDTAPMRMGAGLVRDDFVAMLMDSAARHGMLMVLDEVVSFRLGYAGSQGVLGIEPDITAIGKIIGGGFPVGGVAGRSDVMSVFAEIDGAPARLHHGGTFNANPTTMSAGLAAMRDMTPAAFAALDALGDYARSALTEALARGGVTGQVTGSGSLFRLCLHDRPIVTIRDAASPPDENRRAAALRSGLIDRGYFLGNGLSGCLSTQTTRDHVDGLCAAVTALLPEVTG
ncbi:MAG: aminotransferase class III-fold pyridoxal phosphate-dependent enzyme [Pseudomonadales bacterium]